MAAPRHPKPKTPAPEFPQDGEFCTLVQSILQLLARTKSKTTAARAAQALDAAKAQLGEVYGE